MGQKNKWQGLEERTYRFKKVDLEFFCPLCSSKRAITTGHRLTILNYGQIALVTGLFTALLWPWAGLRGFLCFFPFLMVFEGARRMLFSRGVPCPHCGFDAAWYKRDVKVARRLVDEFWEDKDKMNLPEDSPQHEQQVSE